MTKFIYSVLLFLLTFSFSNAQEAKVIELAEKVEKDTTPFKLPSSLLWEITGNELETPSYLYGTIHMIGKDDFVLTDATRAALAKTDKITYEINMEDMNSIGVIFTMIGKVMMKNGVTLQSLLSKEDYKLVVDHFEKMGLPMMMLEKIKPMFLTVFASEDMATMQTDMQTGGMVSYEMELMAIAEEQKKEMDGLETVEFQMSVFDSIPYEAQAQMLVESLKAENTGEEDEFDVMTKMYKDQDINGMVSMISEDGEGMQNYEQVLLINRNLKWIPIMGEMMKEQPTFFAVGAGHLGGPQGVVNLLTKEGYNVKPIDAGKSLDELVEDKK